MDDKIEVLRNDQIVLTRINGSSPPMFSVHRTGRDRGFLGNPAFTGTFDEAVRHIRDQYEVDQAG